MKNLLLFCSMAVLLMISCNKEEPIENDPTDQIEYPATADVIRDAVTDIDGNKYDAVRIGDQVWMAMNMRTTRFADGTDILTATETSFDTPYRYMPYYTNGGYLYNWQAAMHGVSGSDANPSSVQGVCPDGWHLPSEAEWQQLTDYLSNHSEYVCSGEGENIAKSLAVSRNWSTCGIGCAVGYNQEDNNATGFSAMPVGYYPGSYTNYGYNASFWSTTEVDSTLAVGVNLNATDSLVRRPHCTKLGGLSVRCVQNE